MSFGLVVIGCYSAVPVYLPSSSFDFSMLQRVQSLFLLGAILLTATTFFLPFATLTPGEGAAALHLRSYGVKSMETLTYLPEYNSYFIFLPLTLVIMLTGWVMFSFKDRKKQLALIRFAFILYAVSFVMLYLYISHVAKALPNGKMSIGASFFLPVIALVLTWFAAKNIRKDEELVRSVDRIR